MSSIDEPVNIAPATFLDAIAACVVIVAVTNAKLSKVPPELRLALIVKAADRLANLRTLPPVKLPE